jgi:hypothetical protein
MVDGGLEDVGYALFKTWKDEEGRGFKGGGRICSWKDRASSRLIRPIGGCGTLAT